MAIVTLNSHPPSTKNHVWPWQHLSWLETHSALAGEAAGKRSTYRRLCWLCYRGHVYTMYYCQILAWVQLQLNCMMSPPAKITISLLWLAAASLSANKWPLTIVSTKIKSKQTWTRWPFTEIVGAYISNLPITIYSNPTNTYVQTKYLNRYM